MPDRVEALEKRGKSKSLFELCRLLSLINYYSCDAVKLERPAKKYYPDYQSLLTHPTQRLAQRSGAADE